MRRALPLCAGLAVALMVIVRLAAQAGAVAAVSMGAQASSTNTSRSRMPATGAAYHPQAVVTAAGTLLVAWEEVIDGVRRVRLARGPADASGARRFDVTTTSEGEPGVYPALAVRPAHAVLAWTSRRGTASAIQVRRIEG